MRVCVLYSFVFRVDHGARGAASFVTGGEMEFRFLKVDFGEKTNVISYK